MRFNIMFGLDHVPEGNRKAEISRLLLQMEKELHLRRGDLQPGDSVVLTDIHGKRVGVTDVFKD